VIYDRLTSKSDNRSKRFFLNFATQPVLTGNLATVTTPKGQKVFVRALLPANGVITTDKPTTTWDYNEATTDEPMHYRLITTDFSNPKDTRFLNVIQFANANSSAFATTMLTSSAGSAYEGAAFAGTVVMFAKDLGQAFNGLTYVAPANSTVHYVTGLKAGAGYTVTKTVGANGLTVAVTAGGSLIADPAGMLRF